MCLFLCLIYNQQMVSPLRNKHRFCHVKMKIMNKKYQDYTPCFFHYLSLMYKRSQIIVMSMYIHTHLVMAMLNLVEIFSQENVYC